MELLIRGNILSYTGRLRAFTEERHEQDLQNGNKINHAMLAAVRYLVSRVKHAVCHASSNIPFISAADTPEEQNLRAQRFIKIHGNSILRLAYSYLHNMEDSEDVLQDTIIRVLEANPVFDSEEHEKAYLLRCAANAAKNRIEYNRYRETDELNEELVAGNEEDLSFVWEAVKQLTEKEREVIHLFYVEGYRTAEIAKLLGRNESTVRSDLKRARDRLKDILKEDYDFD